MRSTMWRNSPHKELLIYVNGSSDGTEDVARRLEAQHTEVKVRCDEVGSKGRARNRLVDWSNPHSDILCFMDADVEPAEDTFEKLCRALADDPSLTLAGGCCVPVPETNTTYGPIQRHFARLLSQPVIYERRERIGLVPGACYAIRRCAAVSVRVPEEAMIGEDTCLNAIFAGQKVVVKDAWVYFLPPGFFDRIRVSARHRRSFELLRAKYPEIWARFVKCYSTPFRKTLFRDFLRLPCRVWPSAIVAFFAMALGTALVRVIKRKESHLWHAPASTKKTFMHPKPV